MIKYTYNQSLKKHQFIIHEEIDGYYISFMYEETIEEEIDCMLMSNANDYTDEKICEEIVKKLRNKLIQYNEECTNIPKNIIDYVCEELISEFNINIKF
jgi:hypothetical protein